MKPDLHMPRALRREFSDWRRWLARAIVIAAAALAGLTVVAFTWLSEQALQCFFALSLAWWWGPLVWTPLSAAAIVWVTRRFAPGAAGSGIPQVMAALDPGVDAQSRGLFVGLRLAAAKIGLTAWGLLAGLSLGREGPSVQIAAGVMSAAQRWLPRRTVVTERVAGGRRRGRHRRGLQHTLGRRHVCHRGTVADTGTAQ